MRDSKEIAREIRSRLLNNVPIDADVDEEDVKYFDATIEQAINEARAEAFEEAARIANGLECDGVADDILAEAAACRKGKS